MKSVILKSIARLYAKVYWAYLKPEVDNYVLNLQKKSFLHFGKNIIFKGGGEIFHPENIVINNYVQIGNNYFLMGIGGIEIGEGTIISRNVCIHSGNHHYDVDSLIPYSKDYVKRKVIVGKGVWIGQNVNILPGVNIGDGAIIGMGTTVSKNVAPYTIVVGGTQRVIGSRDEESFNKLLKEEEFYGKYY